MSLIANKTEYVSIHTILPDFYEDNNIVQKDVDESLLLKWASDKIQDISTDRQLVHRLGWLNVHNYKIEMPEDLVTINEIAYKTAEDKDIKSRRDYEIVQYVQDTHSDDDVTLELNVICNRCGEPKTSCNCGNNEVVVDINTAFEVSHPEMYYSKYLRVGRFGYGKSIYSPQWDILCHTNDDWFGVDKHLPGCANISCRDCSNTYRVNPPIIETSFEEGEVLISYMGRMMDENGDIMIPKHRDVFEAILQYLTYKWYRREFMLRRDPSDRAIYQEAFQLTNQATDRAIARISMPSFEEFSKFWSNNKWSKLDDAYGRLMHGRSPISRINKDQRNIYKS